LDLDLMASVKEAVAAASSCGRPTSPWTAAGRARWRRSSSPVSAWIATAATRSPAGRMKITWLAGDGALFRQAR